MITFLALNAKRRKYVVTFAIAFLGQYSIDSFVIARTTR